MIQRPALASAWEPFYSSSPSFSARSTASIVSLQGKNPLPGHPKTLRDLSNASEMLTLPSSFGAIQLGETFSSCLSVNNEAGVDVAGVSLKVEMQTATSKITLAEIRAGEDGVLNAGDAMEAIVQHEIKELGQHVLACAVSYRLPSNVRKPPSASEDADDRDIQAFSKFYKFAVGISLFVYRISYLTTF
jgi:trafficking protein particle complex subunit 13